VLNYIHYLLADRHESMFKNKLPRVGIVGGGGVEPPVRVYRRSFLSENWP